MIVFSTAQIIVHLLGKRDQGQQERGSGGFGMKNLEKTKMRENAFFGGLVDYLMITLVEFSLVDITFASLYSFVSESTKNPSGFTQIVGIFFAVIILVMVLGHHARLLQKLTKKQSFSKNLVESKIKQKNLKDQILGQILSHGLNRDEIKDQIEAHNLNFCFLVKIVILIFTVVSLQNSPYGCLIGLLITQLVSSFHLIYILFRSRKSGVFENWPACLSHCTTELTLLTFTIISLAQKAIIKDANKHSSSISFDRLGVALVAMIVFSITMEVLDFAFTCWGSLCSILCGKKVQKKGSKQDPSKTRVLSRLTLSRRTLRKLAQKRLQEASDLERKPTPKSNLKKKSAKIELSLDSGGWSSQRGLIKNRQKIQLKPEKEHLKLEKLSKKGRRSRGSVLRNSDRLKEFAEDRPHSQFVGLSKFYNKRNHKQKNLKSVSYKKLKRLQHLQKNQ